MLRTSLERLLVEIDPRRQRELHTLVAGELERCKQEPRLVNGSISTSESAAELSGHAGSGAHASHAPGDDYWPAFRAACQPTMPPRVRETALDLVQKMLAHRHMRGNRPIDYEPGEAVPTNAAANMLTEPVSSSVANGEPSSSGVLGVNAAEEPRPGATTASTLTTPVRSVEAARSSTLIDDIIHA